MRCFFFPKFKQKISTDNSLEHNRAILSMYCKDNILLWIFWALFFMVYSNYQENINLHSFEDVDISISTILHYFFTIVSVTAIGLSKILDLSEEKASALCKALRGNNYKE